MSLYAVLCRSTLPLCSSLPLSDTLRPSPLVRSAPLLSYAHALPLSALLRLHDAALCLSLPMMVSRRGSDREVVGLCW